MGALSAFTLALLGCQTSAPAAESPAPSAPGEDQSTEESTEESPVPVQTKARPTPERQGPEDCQVLLRVDLMRRDDMVTLRAVARNLTREILKFDLPEKCPAGLIDFEGLGSGYDYYQTCNKGACVGFPEIRSVQIGPGQEHPLASTYVSLAGQAPCTKPLSGTEFEIRALAPETNVTFCTESALLELPAPLTERERAERGRDPYFCEKSSECVLSCPDRAGCCGNPCGCRHAIHRTHQAAYEENFAASCLKPPCPAYGCAYQPAFSAVCHENRCIGADTVGAF